MEKSIGNLSLSTQETHPVTLNEEYPGNPTCGAKETVVAVYIYIHLFLCFSYLL